MTMVKAVILPEITLCKW